MNIDMFTIVIDLFQVLLSISIVVCKDIKTTTLIPATSSKTIAGVSIARTNITGNKNAQFLNNIIDDLRKDNDDYQDTVRINISNPYLNIDKQTAITLAKSATTKTLAILNKFPHKTENVTNNDAATLKTFENRRRFSIPAPVKRFIANKKITFINKTPMPKLIDKVIAMQRNRYAKKKDILTKKMQLVNREEYPKHVNKGKVNKFEKYATQKKGIRDILMKKPVNSGVKLRVSSSREQELKEQKAKEDSEIPTGDQLDMAPGKGGRMHAKRLKNYLCHRHVMLPEGPKYDSQGKVYLAAYKKVYGRDYAQTHSPIFLLPKCCNCCKKSVLGCE